ncbi:alpha/beta hydrolase [Spirosoma luteum]|uniref:alpha/beta hydrolase n=1 Tax=Spirosoma luteum TaxID=431553 RepID=UPI0003792FE6|nr:alpha/beta hydrolase [Spirosoma luteum]
MFIYKILKRPFFGNFMVKWRSPLSVEQQREWEPFSVKSKSGGILQGLFARSKTNEEKSTIVLGHPMGKEAKGYFIKHGYTDLLREHGFNTVVFDINGFGESTHGNFSYFDDIVAMGIKASELTPAIPIGYHGISLGGQMATIAFADPTHPYRFAIVESAAITLEDFWIQFPVSYKMLQLFNLLLPTYKKKVRMIERIKEAKHLSSLLLIYSKSDDWVPVEMGMKFKEHSPVATELWMVANAQHASMMKSEHKDAYSRKILDYFDRSSQHLENK